MGRKAVEFEIRHSIPNYVVDGHTDTQRYFKHKLAAYRAILSATDLIDFGCRFNDKGVCHDRSKYVSPLKTTEMCCCVSCAHNRGYLLRAPIVERDLSTYRHRWHKLNGFWQKGKGCVLPREHRSITCIFYNCLPYEEKASKIIRNLKNAAEHLLDELFDMIEKEGWR